ERSALNVNQVRRIVALEGGALAGEVTRVWGQVRSGRNPEREKLVARMRGVLAEKPGDPWKGKEVFEKTCLQCHLLFGKGNNVGPDLTVNGRETLDALLTNVLDPNLVIGKDYYAWTALDSTGRVLNGLLVEDSPQRVVLKVAGGKEEVIPRGRLRSLEASELSLMPEDLDQTLKEEEFRHLIAYLRYEEAPPEPVAVTRVEAGPGERRRLEAGAVYGELTVWALPSEAGGERKELLR